MHMEALVGSAVTSDLQGCRFDSHHHSVCGFSSPVRPVSLPQPKDMLVGVLAPQNAHNVFMCNGMASNPACLSCSCAASQSPP